MTTETPLGAETSAPSDGENELTHDDWETAFERFEASHEADGTSARAIAAMDRERRFAEVGKFKYKDKGAAERRRYEIHAYVGANGSGKSLAMVHDSIASLMAGRTVLSTVKLLDPWTGNAHPNYVRLTDWRQVLETRNADLLLDEIIGIASSRASGGMPQQIANILNQLRRRDVLLRWTAPAWSRADVVLREVTKAVTVCRGYLSVRNESGEGADLRMWSSKMLFRWSTYAAEDFATWSDSKESKLQRLRSTWFWGPSSEAFRTYDTFDYVERVGEVSEAGVCVWCGGSKARPKCQCDPAAHSHASIGL